ASNLKIRMFADLFPEIADNLMFKLTLLLTVAIASSFLFSRLGQPKIVGQIILGIVIGPSFLAIITVSQDQGTWFTTSLSSVPS
ncbi:MAG TPA: hypothetical protein ENN25_03420, partial [Euryarchaeota archaeon]|nr:hypothetical protein [Euryarchaeota archaeon]